MSAENKSILDHLLADHAVVCQINSIEVMPDDIVHIVGSQEPVRGQPDGRARTLYQAKWLDIDLIQIAISETERAEKVRTLQSTTRSQLKSDQAKDMPTSDHQQLQWLIAKTRPHESKQQIAQRVWLTLVLYSLGYRDLHFDTEGQILSSDVIIAGRIGIAPDKAIDMAWMHPANQTFAASFRQPDGTITRGKGRQRWYTYRLTVSPKAKILFERRKRTVTDRVAIIVASETNATQPQLPRDFYGGDAFQQACIDAQDGQFNHILVLSPQHGVISLDDVVPADQSWEKMLDRYIWSWQVTAVQKLGMYLFGDKHSNIPEPDRFNWWPWLNPQSRYELTIFGSGFAVRIFIDYLSRSRSRSTDPWPDMVIAEQRAGYDVGDYDDGFDFNPDMEDDYMSGSDFDSIMQDIDHLMDLANEFASLVTVTVPPTSEEWEIAPDEAILPVRLLSNTNMDLEDLLDLLTDITLLLESTLPVSLIINAGMVVSALLQITHSLVHDETEPVARILETFPEAVLHQYIQRTLQETNKEDQLCACLTLAEQMQLISLSIPPDINGQLLIWLQTYLSARMRQQIMGSLDETE